MDRKCSFVNTVNDSVSLLSGRKHVSSSKETLLHARCEAGKDHDGQCNFRDVSMKELVADQGALQ